MRLIKFLGYFILLFFMNSCTFYSLKGTIPSHINNVYIQPIINKSSDQRIIVPGKKRNIIFDKIIND